MKSSLGVDVFALLFDSHFCIGGRRLGNFASEREYDTRED